MSPSSPHEPADPAFSRRLIEDDYFRHLLSKQFATQFKENLRAEADRATSEYWGVRWKLGATVVASLLSVAGLFGYSSLNKMTEQVQAQVTRMDDEYKRFTQTQREIEARAAAIKEINEHALADRNELQTSIKSSLEDARTVVRDYTTQGKNLFDTTRDVSDKTFRSLESNLSNAARDTARLQTVAEKTDTAMLAAAKLQTDSERRLSALQEQTDKLNTQIAAMERTREQLSRGLSSVDSIRQFAATSASEVFALRSDKNSNAVTLALPDLNDPTHRYSISFKANGLRPPVILEAAIDHPDPAKRWSGKLNLDQVKMPVRISGAPFIVEMDFLYHTKAAPDFAIFRIRYETSALAPLTAAVAR
jgi:hypothetical protein